MYEKVYKNPNSEYAVDVYFDLKGPKLLYLFFP